MAICYVEVVYDIQNVHFWLSICISKTIFWAFVLQANYSVGYSVPSHSDAEGKERSPAYDWDTTEHQASSSSYDWEDVYKRQDNMDTRIIVACVLLFCLNVSIINSTSLTNITAYIKVSFVSSQKTKSKVQPLLRIQVRT